MHEKVTFKNFFFFLFFFFQPKCRFCLDVQISRSSESLLLLSKSVSPNVLNAKYCKGSVLVFPQKIYSHKIGWSLINLAIFI